MKHISHGSIASIRNLTFLLFIIGLSTTGCRKNGNPGPAFPGNYTGVYEYSSNGIWYQHEVTAASFTFNGSTFTANNIIQGIRNSATGKYHIINDSTVNSSTVTRASTATGVITNGNYSYRYKLDTLTISYITPLSASQYRSKKN